MNIYWNTCIFSRRHLGRIKHMSKCVFSKLLWKNFTLTMPLCFSREIYILTVKWLYHWCHIYKKTSRQSYKSFTLYLCPRYLSHFVLDHHWHHGIITVYPKSTNRMEEKSELHYWKQSFRFCRVLSCLESLNTYSSFSLAKPESQTLPQWGVTVPKSVCLILKWRFSQKGKQISTFTILTVQPRPWKGAHRHYTHSPIKSSL